MIEEFKNSSFQNFLSAYEVKNPKSFGLIKIKSGRVVGFLEKPTVKNLDNVAPYYINPGFYIFSPKVFKEFPKKSFSVEKEVFPKLACSRQLGAFTYKGFWQDVGTEERLEQVRKMFKNKSFKI